MIAKLIAEIFIVLCAIFGADEAKAQYTDTYVSSTFQRHMRYAYPAQPAIAYTCQTIQASDWIRMNWADFRYTAFTPTRTSIFTPTSGVMWLDQDGWLQRTPASSISYTSFAGTGSLLTTSYVPPSPTVGVVGNIISVGTNTASLPDLSIYATKQAVNDTFFIKQMMINGKFNNPNGTTFQYLRGDGSIANFPSIPAAATVVAGSNATVTQSGQSFTITGTPATDLTNYYTKPQVDAAFKPASYQPTVTGAGIAVVTQTGGAITVSVAPFTQSLQAIPAVTLTSGSGNIGVIGGNTVAVSITSTQISNALGGTPVVQQYSATPGEGIVVTQVSPNVQKIAVDTAEATSGAGAIMYVGKATNAIGSLNGAIATKVSTATTLQFVGGSNITVSPLTPQNLSSNRIWTISAAASAAQTSVNAGSNISVTGTAPNYTVTNTAPDQVVTQTGTNGISVSGSYPNFTLSSVMAAYTPVSIAAASRTINASTCSPCTSYSVSTGTHFDFSCTASINLGVLGNGTGTVYLETSPNGSAWTFRGNIVKVSGGGIAGLATGNGATYGIDLPAGTFYRLMFSSSVTGVGNTVTSSFDGGSFYTK